MAGNEPVPTWGRIRRFASAALPPVTARIREFSPPSGAVGSRLSGAARTIAPTEGTAAGRRPFTPRTPPDDRPRSRLSPGGISSAPAIPRRGPLHRLRRYVPRSAGRTKHARPDCAGPKPVSTWNLAKGADTTIQPEPATVAYSAACATGFGNSSGQFSSTVWK